MRAFQCDCHALMCSHLHLPFFLYLRVSGFSLRDQKERGTPVKPYVWRIVVLVVIEVAQMSIARWIDQKAGGQKKMNETRKEAKNAHVQIQFGEAVLSRWTAGEESEDAARPQSQ